MSKLAQSYDVLIIDDEFSICKLLSGLLEDEGYSVGSVQTSEDAFKFFEEHPPKVAIVDVWLDNSENDGLKILEVLRRDYTDCPVLMMSGHGTVDIAVKAIQLGASDFITKPFRSDVFLNYIRRLLEERRLRYENRELKKLITPEGEVLLKGDSREIRALRKELSRTLTNSSHVVLEGDMGVGKTSLARYIHNKDKNRTGPLITLSYLSEGGAELFAKIFGQVLVNQDKKELEGGTLVLKDADTLPMDKQRELLQGLLRHQKEDWGEKGIYRLIVTTRKDIKELMVQGLFDESLYYRLSVIRLVVPNLSSRRLDIGIIAKSMIKEKANLLGRRPRVITREAISVMQSHHWIGNMHKLINIVERLLLADAKSLPVEGLEISELLRDGDDNNRCSEDVPISNLFGKSLREARKSFEILYIKHHLANCEGNVSKLSDVCGMERTALHRKMKQLLIEDSKSEDTRSVV